MCEIIVHQSIVMQSQNHHIMLARKYRPKSLTDVMGQDILVQTLRNAFASNRVPQAILLTGTRGIGKTTIARIIAKYLNCLNIDLQNSISLQTADEIECCNKCDNCITIANSSHPDVLELDAASNTGVSDIREIIDSVRYKPIKAKKKVYIIDEVHMLSNSAFNALLKTLEEPPLHVYFILATTEENKVLRTIVSRCQQFRLHPITAGIIEAQCDRILYKEGYVAEKGVTSMVAKAAYGSMRDALSMLDSAISFCADTNNSLLLQKLLNMLGYKHHSNLYNAFKTMCSGDVQNCLKEFTAIYNAGVEPTAICENLLSLIHEITKLKIDTEIVSSQEQSIWCNDSSDIKGTAEAIEMPFLLRGWHILNDTLSMIKLDDDMMHLEMALIKLMYLNTMSSPENILEMLNNGEIRTNDRELYKSTNEQLIVKQNVKATDNENIMQNLIEKSMQEPTSGFTQLSKMKQLHAQYDDFLTDRKQLEMFNQLRIILALLLEKNEVMLYYRLSTSVKLINISIADSLMTIAMDDKQALSVLEEIRSDMERITNTVWTINIDRTAQNAVTYLDFLNKLDEQHEKALLKTNLVASIMSEFDNLTVDRIIPSKEVH